MKKLMCLFPFRSFKREAHGIAGCHRLKGLLKKVLAGLIRDRHAIAEALSEGDMM